MEQRRRPTILYVDDTPEARALVSRLLSSDYTILEADNPLTGIEIAVQQRPDLILLDINLPHLSGREVATRLRSLLPTTPLVAFTADNSQGARERALAAGCDGFLTKPLDVDTFPDQIEAFLHGAREHIPNLAEYNSAYQAELVAQLEQKVRELSKAAESNRALDAQNQRMLRMLRRRERLLEGAARVGHSITSILDLNEVLRATVDIICDEYDFYYAAIFLLDPSGKWAVLRAGRGDAGAAMLADGHKLVVGGNSMVGTAISLHSARIALDVGEESVHFKNPHLPKTRSEMALPLMVKDQVLGALSVQSEQVNAFSNDDITALQALANQVAIAINNARLLRDLNAANQELLRTKTFEAIATATGEAIHWVGNKAAPIPSSARRVRDDLQRLLAVFHTLLGPTIPADHPLASVAAALAEEAKEAGVDLAALAEEVAAIPPAQRPFMASLQSILEDLTIIEQSATTILNIKEDLIGPARLQQPEAVELPALISETAHGMALPSGVITLRFAPDLPPIHGDSRQLGQVFNNLIKNAWEALHRHPSPQIEVVVERDHSYPEMIACQVRDNGPGIPPELLDKIWVSFFTTKGDRGGTGLGLAACMAIVSQVGGRIAVESRVGVGTTFTVLLPIFNASP